MAHEKNTEQYEQVIVSISETETPANDRKLQLYRNEDNQLVLTVTFPAKDAKVCNFINELFIAETTDYTEGNIPPEYGLKYHPESHAFTITKNLPKALDFLHFHKQITQQQKDTLNAQIKREEKSTASKSDNSTTTIPADESDSSNHSCCHMM